MTPEQSQRPMALLSGLRAAGESLQTSKGANYTQL